MSDKQMPKWLQNARAEDERTAELVRQLRNTRAGYLRWLDDPHRYGSQLSVNSEAFLTILELLGRAADRIEGRS